MTPDERMAMEAYLNRGNVVFDGMDITGGGSLVVKDQVSGSGLGNMLSDGFGGVNSIGSILPLDLQKQLATAVNTNYKVGPYKNSEHGGDIKKNDSNNTLGYVNAGIQGIGTLGNMYFAKKNADLQEDFTNWQKGKVAESDARKRQFAKNVGGTY